MAQDDYYVIVYKILAYLYTQLKAGADIDEKLLQPHSALINVNQKYWIYIFENLQEQGYIKGLCITKPWGNETLVDNLEACQITPLGITYLCENSLMQKAKNFLKELGAFVPLIK